MDTLWSIEIRTTIRVGFYGNSKFYFINLASTFRNYFKERNCTELRREQTH